MYQLAGLRGVLQPVVDARDGVHVRAHLPGETLHEARAFHVPAEETERESKSLPEHPVLKAQEMERLDEAGDADDRIPARVALHLGDDAG